MTEKDDGGGGVVDRAIPDKGNPGPGIHAHDGRVEICSAVRTQYSVP
jgi:hypothetical protein